MSPQRDKKKDNRKNVADNLTKSARSRRNPRISGIEKSSSLRTNTARSKTLSSRKRRSPTDKIVIDVIAKGKSPEEIANDIINREMDINYPEPGRFPRPPKKDKKPTKQKVPEENNTGRKKKC